MKLSIKTTVAESKVGAKTKTFSNTSSIVWNLKRRFK